MTIDTNNIAALRTALEQLDAFEAAWMDTLLPGMDDDQVEDNIGEIRGILTNNLQALEALLIARRQATR